MPELRIRVRCPHCPNLARLPKAAVGKTVKCSKCGQAFAVEHFEAELIQVRCPFCPNAGLAEGESVNKEVRCVECGKLFLVEHWLPQEGHHQDVAILAFDLSVATEMVVIPNEVQKTHKPQSTGGGATEGNSPRSQNEGPSSQPSRVPHMKTPDQVLPTDLGVKRATEDDEFIWGQFLPILVPVTTCVTILIAGWLMFGFALGFVYLLGFIILAAGIGVGLAKRRGSTLA